MRKLSFILAAAVLALLPAAPVKAADVVLSTGLQFLPGFRMVDGNDLNKVLDRVNDLSDGTWEFTGPLLPATANTYAIGSATDTWSDLFLGSGGVINWNAGDMTITHSSAQLAIAGAAGAKVTLTSSSASTDGGTSVQPFVVNSTMTGAGGVGGRAYFGLSTNVALGAWSNALKGEVVYGASGSTTGLGSSILAEMQLSAGTSSGSYAPLEIELGLGTGALTGTRTSFMSLNAYGDDVGTLDTNGFLFDLNGVSAGASNLFSTGAVTGIGASGALRIKIGATAYYIPICTAAGCGGS